jgi:sterol desaturase/sphingolipid hydroxylase (fatty acid hydroxylase superfamily)
VDLTVFNTLNCLGIAILLGLELRSAVFRKVLRDPRRMRRNLAYLVVSFGAGWLLHRIAAYLPNVLPDTHWAAPMWVQIPLVFLLAEWMNWMLHWAKHENGYLWRFHCQHHKETSMRWKSALTRPKWCCQAPDPPRCSAVGSRMRSTSIYCSTRS